jgi:hypothetical protein
LYAAERFMIAESFSYVKNQFEISNLLNDYRVSI